MQRLLDTILLCQNDTGGFGGGFGQLSHLATTYAAVHAIAVIGLERGFDSIRRQVCHCQFVGIFLRPSDFIILADLKCSTGCYL